MTTINTPTSGDDELKLRLEGLTDEQKDKLFEILKQDRLDREKSMGNIDAILEDLKKNHVKIEENKEILNKKGRIVHVDLSSIGKFDCFISNTTEFIEYVHKIYEEICYSEEEIDNFLEMMVKYLKEYGVDTDKYEAGEYLKQIIGLNDDYYWVKDKDKEGKNMKRKPGEGFDKYWWDRRTNPNYIRAYLLLKP